MFLTKDCIKTLKIINRLSPNKSNSIPSSNIVQHFPPTKRAKISVKIRDILIELEKYELVSIYKDDSDNYFVNSTYKGKSYEELQLLQTKDFFIKSVLIPIILTIITSFVTTKITLMLTSQQVQKLEVKVTSET